MTVVTVAGPTPVLDSRGQVLAGRLAGKRGVLARFSCSRKDVACPASTRWNRSWNHISSSSRAPRVGAEPRTGTDLRRCATIGHMSAPSRDQATTARGALQYRRRFTRPRLNHDENERADYRILQFLESRGSRSMRLTMGIWNRLTATRLPERSPQDKLRPQRSERRLLAAQSGRREGPLPGRTQTRKFDPSRKLRSLTCHVRSGRQERT